MGCQSRLGSRKSEFLAWWGEFAQAQISLDLLDPKSLPSRARCQAWILPGERSRGEKDAANSKFQGKGPRAVAGTLDSRRIISLFTATFFPWRG